jgi:DNA-binding MarR family transcriptional regulator
MTSKKTLPNPAAAEAWKLMFEVLMATSHLRTASLERRGLTPNDARALWTLDVTNGRPIGDLAREWGCDPSNATFIVGRLENAGLARREAHQQDRRVKLVFLSRAGATTRDALQAEYHHPPDEVQALSERDLAALKRILKKMKR